jgi:2-polyprenyl-3-methyl-5-hydroxy-6-metoxy-1,4-benzoquinol methylase
MTLLPPGTLLQLLYLKERLLRLSPGFFIEIGPGSGDVTRLLLDCGWSGCSYDIEEKTIEAFTVRFAKEISEGRLVAINEDYLATQPIRKADLIISCMVMEHLNEGEQAKFMAKSSENLKVSGFMIGFVPASPAHWGIEDEIAGHLRRYTRASLTKIVLENHWRLEHLSGLTFPISNLLLPISNYLVTRQEIQKLPLSNIEKTKMSGRRYVSFKTHFKFPFRLLLNPIVFWPFGIIQKFFSKSDKCMVLYFEAKPIV